MVQIAPAAASSAADRPQPATDIERLGDRIAEIAAHLHAATYQLLTLLREFDEREGWSGGGFLSCAHWLSWRTGIGAGAAREKVRVARALAALPNVGDAMRRGRLSFAKVRAITRVATPENEAQLLEVACTATAAQLERIVRAWRRVDRLEELEQEQDRHAQRHLNIFIDDDGSYVVRGRLDPEVGAVLMRAMEAAERGMMGRPTVPVEGEQSAVAATEPGPPTPPQRRADAIGLVAEAALRNGIEDRAVTHRADRYQVLVHVDAGATAEISILDGHRVSAETSRRVACDASRVVITHDADGMTLDVGRRTRTVPAAIRRALEHRDRGCRFPGCASRFCDAHHVRHWIDGGRTRLDNLVLLCRRHHRAVHEGGCSVELRDSGEVVFGRSDGSAIPVVPPAPTVQGDAIAQLQRNRRDEGTTIDACTCGSTWAGEPLDLDFALLALRGGRRRVG
jgi:hypothetical protein